MLRLAPPFSELPLKTMLATLLAASTAAISFTSSTVPPSVKLLIAIISPIFIFAPIALSSIARSKRYTLAKNITNVLYWNEGNQQVYALEENWERVLTLKIPDEGDNAFLGLAARVKAYLSLDRLELASQELTSMRERWEREGQGPIGYRAIFLSETRLLAERGQFERVRENLQNPPPGIASFQLFEVLARAAQQSGQHEQALKLYQQAYVSAPEGLQAKFARILETYGQPLPEIIRKRSNPKGTFGLMTALALAFIAQVILERTVGPSAAVVTAGFLDRVPGIPDSTGAWRYLSYAFVHGGILHAGMNIYVLFDIGRLFEIRRNWGNLLAAFVIGSIMGAYFSQLATAGGVPLVGASGGVLGVAGALLADALRGKTQQDRMLLRSLLQWMVFIVIFSVAIPNVSLWGHVGGVIGGMLWGFVRQGIPQNKRFDWLIGGLSIGLMLYVITAAVMWFIRHS